jgi:hypothetical protein
MSAVSFKKVQGMTDKTSKSDSTKAKSGWNSKAALAGAAIGSAALAAALLYASSRRKEQAAKPNAPAPRPEDAPETD